MEEELNAGFSLISLCYSYLHNGTDNLKIQFATNKLNEAYRNPLTLQILLRFYGESKENPIFRQEALIGLKHCVFYVWDDIPMKLKIEFFENLLNLLVTESVWINRMNLIDVIQAVMAKEFNNILLSFIQQAFEFNTEAYLEIALILSTLVEIDEDENDMKFHDLEEFFNLMVKKGVYSNQPEVRLGSFYFILFNKLFNKDVLLNEENGYWDKFVDILDSFVENPNELHRLVKLFNYAINEQFYVGNPTSLLGKCLSYFSYVPSLQTPVLMQIFSIVQTICSVYYEFILDNNLFDSTLQIIMLFSFSLFRSDDSLLLTNANYFEQALSKLCYSNEAVERTWSICTQNYDSNEGKFFFVRAIAVSFANAPDFYSEKLQQITELLKEGILSNSSLLRDASARTADEFVKFFVFESDELSLTLVPIVVNACRNNPSTELLIVCSRLLYTTKKTDDFFDTSYPILMSYLDNGPPDIQSASISCLSSLARWSTIKISVCFDSLLQKLKFILDSTSYGLAHLKASAVDCIANLAIVIGNGLEPYINELCNFFHSNLNNEEDIGLSVSCLHALVIISERYPNFIQYTILPILNFILEQASIDHTQEYLRSLNDPNEDESEMIFSISAYSLQLLSVLLVNCPEMIQELGKTLIDYCNIHKMSYSSKCISSCAIAISNFARAISVASIPFEKLSSIVLRLNQILLSILSIENNMDVNYEVFRAASDIVGWLGYDSFGQSLSYFITSINLFLCNKKVQNYRPSERIRDIYESILDFISNICKSAGSESPKYVGELLEPFLGYAKHQLFRFRSYGIRFLGIFVSASKEKLDHNIQICSLELTIEMIQNDLDYAGYYALKKIAAGNPDLIKPYSSKLYTILLEKLSLPFIKTEKMLMMRDNCISAFAILVLYVFEDIEIYDFLPTALQALPLALDFESSKYICDFVIKMFGISEGKYNALFLHLLVILFSNPFSVIFEQLNYDQYDYDRILEILRKIIKETENSNELCFKILCYDQNKINFLKESLFSQEEEEE